MRQTIYQLVQDFLHPHILGSTRCVSNELLAWTPGPYRTIMIEGLFILKFE